MIFRTCQAKVIAHIKDKIKTKTVMLYRHRKRLDALGGVAGLWSHKIPTVKRK